MRCDNGVLAGATDGVVVAPLPGVVVGAPVDVLVDGLVGSCMADPLTRLIRLLPQPFQPPHLGLGAKVPVQRGSQPPHGRPRGSPWPAAVEWRQQIQFLSKEAQMSTSGNRVPAGQSPEGAPRSSLHRRRIRRGTLALAAALSLGLAAGAPAVAAVHGQHGATVQDWQGPSASQDATGSPPWSSGTPGSSDSSDSWGDPAYGSYGSDSSGAASASRTPTKAQSAGVVLIETTLPYQNGRAAGTGMILTSSGQVLTNYHVVHGAGSIRVTVASTGQTYRATVVGSDEAHDVALIQLDGASGLTTIKPDTDGVAVGAAVTAVGNAGGTGTLTAADGRITSLDASVTAISEDGTSPETLDGMLETDANVLAGDSGGPLFDAQGEVIGIDTAGSSAGAPDAYAIPIARALSIARQIQAGHEAGTVRIGPAAFLGVEVGNVAAYGGDRSGGDGSFGSASGGFGTVQPVAQGAQVSGVLSGAAAARAGLQAGDVITSLAGRAVSSPDDVSAALVGANPGDRVAIGWTSQDGSEHTATITLGTSPVA